MVDRPLECSECKRNIAFVYTEVSAEGMTRVNMCADCPLLARRLHGVKTTSSSSSTASKPLTCPECHTLYEAVLTGAPLGCVSCYETFEGFIAKDLRSSLPEGRTFTPDHYHVGRGPGQAATLNPSLRLLALNKALEETLAKEDYEQAAWIRDQIKILSEDASSSSSN